MASSDSWLVSKAQTSHRTNPYAAKSWLITAQALHPNNFEVQYEGYNLEKEAGNVADSAQCFKSLLTDFPEEHALWEEVQRITNALQSDSGGFFSEMYKCLPSKIQQKLFQKMAERSEDIQDYCSQMMLLLRRFPDALAQHGVPLVEKLLAADDDHPLSLSRKLLVCDVLPLLLAEPEPDSKSQILEIPTRLTRKLLEKAIEFYIFYIVEKQSGLPDCQRLRLREFSSRDGDTCMLADPWNSLHGVLESISKSLRWKLSGIFTLQNSLDGQLSQIHVRFEQAAHVKPHKAEVIYEGVFYTTLVLFLQCALDYMRIVNYEASSGGLDLQPNLVLVSVGPPASPLDNNRHNGPPSKMSRTDAGIFGKACSLGVSKRCLKPVEVQGNFQCACKCWHFLTHTDALNKELQRLREMWKGDAWPWLQHFMADYLIAQGEQWPRAVTCLSRQQHLQQRDLPAQAQCRIDLQFALCSQKIGVTERMCEYICKVANNLKNICDESNEAPKWKLPPAFQHTEGSGLLFLSVCRNEMLFYCVKLLTDSMEERLSCSDKEVPDELMGHMIVLLQHNWPDTQRIFLKIMRQICANGSFCYNALLDYLVNCQILKEFAYVNTDQVGKLDLDILQISTASIANQRALTRGIDREVKEDLKVTVEKQMQRCGRDDVSALVLQLLLAEGSSLAALMA